MHSLRESSQIVFNKSLLRALYENTYSWGLATDLRHQGIWREGSGNPCFKMHLRWFLGSDGSGKQRSQGSARAWLMLGLRPGQ